MLRAVAIALGVLLVATGATAAAGDYVVVATNQRVRRPTAGLVHAEMVDELPTATELAADAEVNAHALDSANGIVTSHSVDSAELHPLRNGVATTLFASAPILSAEQQAEADARAQEPGLFTPDALDGAQAVAHSAYVEVEEGVQLLTETERLAMMETAAHAASGARTGSGPRKYLVHAGMNNGGSVLARFEQQTAATCQERCEGDAQCVGFSVVRNPHKRKGLCTLRSTWGSNLDNPDFDSYQAHDYSLAPMPFQDIEAHVKTAIPGQQLLVLADFARVKPARNQKTAELLVSVDHNQPDAVWTNVPSNYRDANSFRAPSVAGVTNPLKSAGDHTVRIDYSRAFEAPAQVDDRSGCQQQRLTAIPFPIELSATRVYDVVGQHWNLAPASSITAKNFVAIPGGVPEADVEGDGGASGAGDAGSMSIKLAVPEDGARVLVFADISRVQHSHGWTNSVFRITVDNQEIAFTNTGEHYGFQYRAIALRGASGSLKKGEHTIAVQAKTQRGKLFFISDGNGYQQRRLTALVVPKGNLWNRKWNLSTAWLKPSKWAELPGAPMRLTVTTEQMGQLLVTVGISRVQSWGNGNVELRLLLSGEKDDIAEGEGYEIARTNTGNVNGWRYQDVSFHAVTPLLAPGTHTVRVQVRSKSGQTVVFYNDGNGLQQRRLSAVLVPPSAGLKSVTQSGVTCTPKLPPSPLPPTPAPATAKPAATPAAPATPATTPAAPTDVTKPAATATPAAPAPAPAPTPAPATRAPAAAASSAAAAAPAVKPSAY